MDIFEELSRLGVSCAPCRRSFLTSTMTWVDATAVLPYFILLTISQDKLQSLGFLRIIRLARVTRMFRLSKHRYNITAPIARIIIFLSTSLYQRYNNIPELFTFSSKLESIEATRYTLIFYKRVVYKKVLLHAFL